MKRFARFSIKARLITLVAFSATVMLIISLVALHTMRASEVSLKTVYENRFLPTSQLGQIIELMGVNRSLLTFGLQHDPDSKTHTWHKHDVSLHNDKVENNIAKVDALWQTYADGIEDPQEAELAEAFAAQHEQFVAEGLRPTMQALSAGDYLKATRVLLKKVNKSYGRSRKAANKLWEYQLEQGRLAYEAAEARHNQLSLVIVALLATVIGLSALLAYVTIRSIATGVSRLNDVSQRMAEGDLTVRCSYTAHNELGHIGSAFNRMADIFQEVIRELSGATVQLAAAAEQTSTITAHTSDRIHQQETDTEHVAAAIEEMNTTVHAVAHTAAEADAAAAEADAKSNEGRDIAAQALAATRDLANEVQNTAEVIARLRHDSDNIGSVLDVIRGIAEQTNLLALNAAIEAARAGEQGRGFAVVADEVRTLAGRTQESTQEIQRMIEDLQQGAQQASQAMTVGQEKATHSLDQVERADRTLEEISRSVTHILELNTQIATAAEQQGTVTEEINRNIVAIRDASAEAVNGAEQTADANTQQAQLAANLQSMAARFTA